MPNSAGEAFSPRCNIEDKLDSLEEVREFLLDMCPLENQDSYDAGKESTLVRILLRTLPSEYDMAVKAVQDLVRLRKASVEGQVGSITNLEDNVRKNYSADWLSKYDELRSELIATWRLMERRREEQGKNQKKGRPTLPILPGHDQPGPHQRKCYGCGKSGHMRGDASCSAGPNGVWDGAPQVWKDRVKKSSDKGGGKSSGKGKGQQKQRNAGKRRVNQMINYLVIIGAAEMGSANMRKPAVSRTKDLRVTRPIRVNLGESEKGTQFCWQQRKGRKQGKS
jgi:hypothetical protein